MGSKVQRFIGSGFRGSKISNPERFTLLNRVPSGNLTGNL